MEGVKKKYQNLSLVIPGKFC